MRMSDEHIDIMVRELIEFDSSLSEREADLRIIIRELIAKKTNITVDPEFAKTLRARLMTSRSKSIVTPYMQFNFWAVRLAPIGVVALLVFMLMPQRLHYLEVSDAPTEESASLESDLFESTAVVQDEMPSAKSAPALYGDDTVQSNTLRVSGMGGDAQVPPPDRFEIGMQQPGVSVTLQLLTLTRPGFAVIHAFNQNGIGAVVGISPLQNGGTTVGVPIYLRTVTRRGEMYYATLYHDNGNGVFSLSDDVPVIDPTYGVPFSTTFTIGFDTLR
jgi:hypothetical protein